MTIPTNHQREYKIAVIILSTLLGIILFVWFIHQVGVVNYENGFIAGQGNWSQFVVNSINYNQEIPIITNNSIQNVNIIQHCKSYEEWICG